MQYLHLSDLHFGKNDYSTLLARTEFTKIKDILHQYGLQEIDCMFITGDMIYARDKKSRNMSNMTELQKYIEYILNYFSIDLANLFIVPGNHDVKRTPARTDLCEKVINEYDIQEGLSESAYGRLLNGFRSFGDLYKNIFSMDFNVKPHLDVRNFCNVLSLNTALVSGRDSEDRTLIVDIKQILMELQKADKQKITIAIGHHPLESIYDREKAQLLDLFNRNGIQIYLCGHEHQMIIDSIDFLNQNGSNNKLYQCKCGTLMTKHPDRSNTDMLIYAGSIEKSGKGKVLSIIWDRRFNTWVPDGGISYHHYGQLDGLFHMGKDRIDLIVEKVGLELRGYGATIERTKLLDFIKENDPQTKQRVIEQLEKEGALFEIGNGTYRNKVFVSN